MRAARIFAGTAPRPAAFLIGGDKKKGFGNTMRKMIAATAFAATALFVGVPAIAADAPNQDPGVTTGKDARTPDSNSVGVEGQPGNKNGPAMGTDSNSMSPSSSGSSTGAAGSDAAAGVKGDEGNKNGPSAKTPDSGSTTTQPDSSGTSQ
jgi:hypothetical protein